MKEFLKFVLRSGMRALPLLWSRAIRYRYYAGVWPRLRHPVGINEKVNWRIINDHREIWNWTCDKLLSKQRVAELSPGILMPSVLWSGSDVDELAGLDISGRWILKSNNSSKDVVPGSGVPDIEALRAALSTWDDFQYRDLGERAYGLAEPVAVLEQWIGDPSQAPHDYKVYVFDGVARYVHTHSNRFTDHRSSIYTREWERVDARQDHIEPDLVPIERPAHLDELLARAEQIAMGLDFVRIDLFDTEEGVWFGEVTPYSWSGLRPFRPQSFEEELGGLWTLPELAVTRR